MAAKSLDRFVLKEILSDGGAGTVYRADEMLPGEAVRPVALKVLPQIDPNDAGTAARFYNEVRVLAQLAVHPNVVTIYSMGLTQNYPWLAMEFAPTTFASRIGEAPGEIADVIKLLEQVGRGLDAMHKLNPPLVHQDLKPANILVDPLGNLKITDFSLATVVAANRTHNLATVRYAAPEILSAEFGRVGPATDLYALGHIAYELALGARLHVRQFPAVFEGNTNKEPAPNKWMMWHASSHTKPPAVVEVRKDFPAGLSGIIAKLMAKPLTERYASAGDLLRDVAREALAPAAATVAAPVAEHSSAGAASPAPPPPPPPPQAGANAPRAPVVSPTAPAASTSKYWVRLRGRVTGPYDLATLQRQVKQGALSRLHQLSTDQRVWKGAAEIEGLYGPTVV
ncbi:MAG: serine/threonine-protein kinase [Phycisphaerae bacterium]